MLRDRLKEFIKYQGLTISAFESAVGLSNGSVAKTNDNMRARTVDSILKTFPELNRTWLLTGEGSMLKEGVSQTSYGDHSPNVNGDNNTIGNAELAAKALEALAEQQRIATHAMEQLDRALTIIEKLQTK